MFRLYDLPRAPAAGSGAAFYESKRLLAAFAAPKYPVKTWRGGRAADHMRYLIISALTLDAGAGACDALDEGRCGIYARRPLAWQIAAEAGLIGAERLRALIAAQAAVIDRALAAPCTASARETLGEMRAENRALLNG